MAKQLVPHEKPWCICKLGSKTPTRIIHRYVKRQDAENHLRQVNRFTSAGQYVVAFDVIEIED